MLVLLSIFMGSAMALTLTSSAFKQGEPIPSKYTISPDLAWTGVPEGTKSFALIFDDPDTPHGLWIHWSSTFSS